MFAAAAAQHENFHGISNEKGYEVGAGKSIGLRSENRRFGAEGKSGNPHLLKTADVAAGSGPKCLWSVIGD